METPKTIQPATASRANATLSQEMVSAELPWLQDAADCVSPASGAARARRSGRNAETVHWSIVALTVFAAAGVLFGGHAGNSSGPKELLPVMIVTSAP